MSLAQPAALLQIQPCIPQGEGRMATGTYALLLLSNGGCSRCCKQGIKTLQAAWAGATVGPERLGVELLLP